MLDVGRICLKTAGKEAGRTVVIVDTLEENFVLIDGQAKRRRCNIAHLEPTQQLIKIKKKASHDDVVKELKKLKIEVKETKPKTKKGPKPVRQRKKKEKIPKKTKKEEKKEKKEEKKREKKQKQEEKKPTKVKK